MAADLLVQILIKTDVTRYLEFRAVDGSFVVYKGKIHKVPSTAKEALSSGLMGPMEKMHVQKLFDFINDYELDDPKTHKGYDMKTVTTRELFKAFELNEETISLIGPGTALHHSEEYLDKPAFDTVMRIKLYFESIVKYSGNSPYLYPSYGIGDLSQAFARLSAIYGGTYMLSKPVEEILYENGKVVGVKSEGQVAKCSFVIADPSYFPDKTKKIGQVIRAICILSAPIPNTGDVDSAQIIIPQKQTSRKYDIYISIVSSAHNVAPKGKYIALVSTQVETSDPEKEIQPGLDLLGKIDEKFISIDDLFVPLEDGSKDNVFISRSYDPETHFGETCQDILNLYQRITGKPMDLTPPPSKLEE
jgi:Rab GDP dissociation inhibitor